MLFWANFDIPVTIIAINNRSIFNTFISLKKGRDSLRYSEDYDEFRFSIPCNSQMDKLGMIRDTSGIICILKVACFRKNIT